MAGSIKIVISDLTPSLSCNAPNPDGCSIWTHLNSISILNHIDLVVLLEQL